MIAGVVVSLCGCGMFTSDESGVPRGTIGYVKGFLGGVAADEPRAALMGRDVLSAGGSAADAAVAVYFTMAVTLPSAASLGGGGICLVRDHRTEKVETLDFRAIGGEVAKGTGAAAIPGNPRGFFALHAKYGRLTWEELLRPAENLARFGTQVSRALAHDLKSAGRVLSKDIDARRIFAKDNRYLLAEGDFLKQPELSATLAQLRSRGGSSLYSGPFARAFVDAVRQSGRELSYDDLRRFVPRWRTTVEVPFIKGSSFHFPAPPGSAGVMAAQMTAMLKVDGLYVDSDAGGRAHLIAETAERALADRSRWRKALRGGAKVEELASDETAERLMSGFQAGRRTASSGAAAAPIEPGREPAEASFAVIDRRGSAVACSLSMNAPFGTGRVARGTGLILATPASERSTDSLATVMLVNNLRSAIYYASGASGGAAAASSMISVGAYSLALDDGTLEKAMDLKRVHHGGADGITYVERGTEKAILDGLARRGHTTRAVEKIGFVNAVFCVHGIPFVKLKPEDKQDCAVRSDPRGFGLASSTD